MADFEQSVQAMQGAISCLGIFVCFWGFTQHCGCLWKVMLRRVLSPQDAHCVRHSYVAMLCLAGIVFAFARLNTIGYLRFGNAAAGLAYIAGMIIMVVTVGLAIWAKGQAHKSPETYATYLKGGITSANTVALARILKGLLVVTLAFVAVGILDIGR